MEALVKEILVKYLDDHRIFHRILYKIDVRSESCFYYLEDSVELLNL